MRPRWIVLAAAVSAGPAGCGGYKTAAGEDGGAFPVDAGAGAPDPGGGTDAAAAPEDAGGGRPAGDAGLRVTVEALVRGRDRVAARSSAGFRPWRGGLAIAGADVVWVESGAQPGLYAIAAGSAPGAEAPRKLASFTRPSAASVGATHLAVADVTALRRFPLAGGAGDAIASSTEEIVNVAVAPGAVFWTEGTKGAIRRTADGTTSTPINSNGTPVGMAAAGGTVFWAGVDISGSTGALQSVGADGRGAREVSRFTGGFHAMGGDSRFLYFAKDTPTTIVRLTLGSGRQETIDRDASGAADFAFDGTFAYWVEPGDGPDYANGRVRRVAHDGTSVETLAVSVARPLAIAVAGGRVYVASAGTRAAGWTDGAILRLTVE